MWHEPRRRIVGRTEVHMEHVPAVTTARAIRTPRARAIDLAVLDVLRRLTMTSAP
jgi:hypothetical protein